jgi:hypothetical protein
MAEGTHKGFWAILAAVLVVVVATHWEESLFLARFFWDLLVLNVLPVLKEWGVWLADHWPF